MVAEERRAHRRHSISPGSFAFYALGSGVIRNLSLGGVFVEDRDASFAVGEEVDLELILSEGDSVVLRGAVRRAQPGKGFAVEFLDLPDDFRRRLETYFRAHFA
ncbi:MAG: PilZ domain-containing protein [Acidobacteria bacterium]|nr:PilZ domain-containing protein [Acidobacteriota bacterium]